MTKPVNEFNLGLLRYRQPQTERKLQRTDGMAIAEACACFLDIIERNNTEALGLKAVTVGRYTAAKNSLYAIIVREEERIRERGTLARELKEVANGRKEQLLLDSPAVATNDGLGEAGEQQDLFENATPEDAEQAKAWTVASCTPRACKELLVKSVLDGDSRTRAIERAKADLGLTKFEAEQHWDDLVREGLITKKGKRLEVRDGALDSLRAPEDKVQAARELVQEGLEAIANSDSPAAGVAGLMAEVIAKAEPVTLTEEDQAWAEKHASLETIPVQLVRVKSMDLLTTDDLENLQDCAICVSDSLDVHIVNAGDLTAPAEFFHLFELELPLKLVAYPHEVDRWIKVHAYAFWKALRGVITWAEYYGQQAQ